MKAQYLLRFDDLCPTMDRARWERYLPLIARFGVRPILAVVPDNSDPDLERDLPDTQFWDKMLALEASGATIGLHGFRHLCTGMGDSLIPVQNGAEFIGVPLEMQRAWIGAGLGILRARGLHPRVWVAPRHGFDETTLRVLREEGIGVVSDGFARSPFRDQGLIWVPQQLWRPVTRASGLWTICVHSNTATDGDVEELEGFLDRFGDRFTSVERVIAEWPIAERSLGNRLFHRGMVFQNRLARLRRAVNEIWKSHPRREA